MTKGATVAKDGRGDARPGGGGADADAGRTRRRGGRDGKSGARWAGGGQIGGVGGGFVPGVRLAGEFFAEVVRPLLAAEFPGLGYAAALIGAGSEVFGFDSERSTDHDWGPRLLVFLEDEEAERLGVAVDEMLGCRLPEVFGGYPVAFGVTRDPGSGVRHRVEVFGLGGWLAWRLGFDPRGGVTVVVTARLARDLMRLWLLMQRRYPPYSKWLGSAFARAPGGAGLGRHLAAALAADGWGARERELGLAYRIAAEAHNRRSWGSVIRRPNVGVSSD